MDQVFLMASGVTALAFLILLLMPKIELGGQSVGAARAAAAAEAAG